MSPFRLIVCALLASSVQLGAFDSVANDAVRQSPAGRASIVGPGIGDYAAMLLEPPTARLSYTNPP